MSKIALSGDAAGTGTFTIASPNSNSNYTLTLPTASGTLITTASTGQVIPKAALPAGSVLQVINTAKTDTFVTSASATDVAVSGLTVAITPISATSKILVICNLGIAAENAQGGATKLTRTVGGSTTQISLANAAGSRSRGSFAGSAYRGNGGNYLLLMFNQNLTYLDSPATTSEVTYGVQVSSISTGTYINRTGIDTDAADMYRGVSYITAMEIAA